MKQYKWKTTWGGFKPNVPIEVAVREFETIEDTYGKLTAKNLLKHSEDPKSPLHDMFEWNNSIAANRYRLEQAGKLINSVDIIVVSDGETREIGAYEIVRTDDGNAYKNISTFTISDVDQLKEKTKEAINGLTKKLRVYSRFKEITFDLEAVVEKLNNT